MKQVLLSPEPKPVKPPPDLEARVEMVEVDGQLRTIVKLVQLQILVRGSVNQTTRMTPEDAVRLGHALIDVAVERREE